MSSPTVSEINKLGPEDTTFSPPIVTSLDIALKEPTDGSERSDATHGMVKVAPTGTSSYIIMKVSLGKMMTGPPLMGVAT